MPDPRRMMPEERRVPEERRLPEERTPARGADACPRSGRLPEERRVAPEAAALALPCRVSRAVGVGRLAIAWGHGVHDALQVVERAELDHDLSLVPT